MSNNQWLQIKKKMIRGVLLHFKLFSVICGLKGQKQLILFR